MHSDLYMPCSFIEGYKRKIPEWPQSVQSTLFLSMKVSLIICLTLILTVSGEKTPYIIPYNYYDLWMVGGQNSSGQLFFDTTPNARRVFIWKPYNASIVPTLFFEKYPEIIQNDIPTTTSEILEGIVPADIRGTSQSTLEEIEEKVPSKHHCGILPASTPSTATLEIPPQGKETSTETTPASLGMNMLHHSLKLAELMVTLSKQRSTPNLTVPRSRNGTFDSTPPSNDSIVYAKDEIDLTKERSRLCHIRREKLHAKRQISPDVATELNLSDAQLNSLQAQVHRRFLMGYDCSDPQEIKPISSFIQDPCEPAEANKQDKYVIEDAAQYQIVQYETRREFQGTRCEKYVSQFTYYCGTADHSSPYPQEIFYRRPKILHWDKCEELASMGCYIAGDSRTYEIPINTRTEVPYFAYGPATAYTGFEGNQITCSGGALMVDGKEIYHMVMYVTEEILYPSEKFVSRDDEDGVIAHFDNVRLTCPIEDEHCVGGDVTYVWRIPLKEHCPLYHIQNFRGQLVKHELTGLTVQTRKIVLSTDQSYVRFVIKGKKDECGQSFLTTNYPDLLIRKTVINGVLDRELITRPLPKDELKLSTFITNRDDYIYHQISRTLKQEFLSVLRDDCKETLRKTKTEHFLEWQLPGLHTYRLGRAHYLTAAGEIAYFYKCQPHLVAAIRADTCYDALPVEIAKENSTLTFYVQADGQSALVPKFYIEPLTHRLTSAAKKVLCLSKFFARYQDIFGQWFAVTPNIATTEPPGKLDLETLRKKISFSTSSDVDLS